MVKRRSVGRETNPEFIRNRHLRVAKGPEGEGKSQEVAGIQIWIIDPYGIVFGTWDHRIVGLMSRGVDYPGRIRRLLQVLQRLPEHKDKIQSGKLRS